MIMECRVKFNALQKFWQNRKVSLVIRDLKWGNFHIIKAIKFRERLFTFSSCVKKSVGNVIFLVRLYTAYCCIERIQKLLFNII